ncbi:MAG: hypothetical protein ACR2FJ_02055 [Qipengyuania sp.]
MRNLILAGAAALALTAAPALAQDMDHGAHDMNQAQQQMYMGWDDEQRIAYQRWPAEVQQYYWTLAPMEVEAWWVLTDPQRVRIYEMTPQQRTAAWQQIAAQMNAGSSQSTTAQARTAAGTSGNIQFRRSEVVQSTPGDQGPPSGEVPICSPNEQDNCINAWEAGKRGPGVTRPLTYWPGKPASE